MNTFIKDIENTISVAQTMPEIKKLNVGAYHMLMIMITVIMLIMILISILSF